MLREEDEPLIPGSARRRVENLVVQFTNCTFTYTQAQIPRIAGGGGGIDDGASAGSSTSTSAGDGAGASSKSKGKAKTKKSKGPSFLGDAKDKLVNYAEKATRRIEGAIGGTDIGRRFDKDCVFRPGDKIPVQNYIAALKLRCQISFVACTFEYREPTLCERISAFILACCGFLVERDPWTGREEIVGESFRIDEIPGVIDKMILNIQQNSGVGSGSIP